LRVVNDPQGYRLEPFDPTEMAPAELREAALLQQALEHERVAEDPLMAVEAIEARTRAETPGQWRAFFGARYTSAPTTRASRIWCGSRARR